MGVKFDKGSLAAEQNSYLTKIGHVYIVYDVEACAKNPLKNVTLKNCSFRANNIVKDSDKEKYVYSGYRIAFDGKGEWSFDNDYARNVIIFGIDNSSSSHAGNLNNFLILVKGDTFGINGSFGELEKNFSINFTKANTKFCLSFHYNVNKNYLFVNVKEIFKFKAECKEISLNRMCMIFQSITILLINVINN